MNPLTQPRQRPTSLSRSDLQKILDDGCAGIHESVLRSYGVLQLVKDLLEKKTDHDVILQIIQLNYDEQS